MKELGNKMKCLTDEQLNNLSQKSTDSALRVEELLHIENCAECKAKLTNSAAFTSAANGIAESILDVVDCPEYETLSNYLDGSIQMATAQKLAAHINSCPLCFTDLERMRSIRSQAVLRGEIVVEAKGQTAKSGAPMWRWVFGTSIGAAALAMIMFVMPMLQRVPTSVPVAHVLTEPADKNAVTPQLDARSKPVGNKPAVPSATKSVAELPVKPRVMVASRPDVVLKDGGLQIVRKDGKLVIKMDGRGGSVEKLIASYVDQKLRTGKVKSEPVQLAMNSIAVRSAQGAYTPSATAPKPSSPVGKVILTAQPLLEWKAVELAKDYQVTVTDPNGRVVYEAVTDKTRVKIDMPLDRGIIYAWRVASRFSDESEWEISSAVAFKVVSSDDVKLIEAARKQMAGSKLALGAVYESLQLQDEAQREYKSLAHRARGVELLRSLNGK
jgi:hypothetical protein